MITANPTKMTGKPLYGVANRFPIDRFFIDDNTSETPQWDASQHSGLSYAYEEVVIFMKG